MTPTCAASSSLVKMILSATDFAENARYRQIDARLAHRARENQMHFIGPIGSGGFEEAFELVELHRVFGASAGGVDENEFVVAHCRDGFAQFIGGIYRANFAAKDLGVFAELIDGGDAESIERDQTRRGAARGA